MIKWCKQLCVGERRAEYQQSGIDCGGHVLVEDR